jgi:cytochrome d ubiquinol oxidase subunit II
MLETWYAIAALTLALYAVLDGFDFGAGALHLILARGDRERRQLLTTIGPWWDANEVWLLAAGGVLFIAFPRALSAGLSGFYFAIFLLLWCLIGRGIAIEFRHQIHHPMWAAFWDAAFAGSSALLALFFGVALGNVVRGVPLDADGWFALPLFTDFLPRGAGGLLDVYTLAAGLFALLVLAAHGASFLAWRCAGGIEARAAAFASRLRITVAIAWPAMTAATWAVNAAMLRACATRPIGIAAVLLALGGLVAGFAAGPRRAGLAFAGSCAFVAGLLAATAAGLFPVLLRSSGDPALSITAYAAGAEAPGLRAALGWWPLGFVLAAGYFVVLFRLHLERTALPAESGGH